MIPMGKRSYTVSVLHGCGTYSGHWNSEGYRLAEPFLVPAFCVQVGRRLSPQPHIQLLKSSVLTTATPVKGLSVSQDPKLVSGRNETRSGCVVELSVPGIKERIDREFARLRNRNPLFGSPVKRVFSPFHSGRIRFRPKVEATCVSH